MTFDNIFKTPQQLRQQLQQQKEMQQQLKEASASTPIKAQADADSTPVRRKLDFSSPAPKSAPSSQLCSSNSVKVFLRLKPVTKEQQKKVLNIVDSQTISFTSSKQALQVPELTSQQHSSQTSENGDKFKFDHVLDQNISQAEVFDKCAVNSVEQMFEGISSLIFAYGVTNAGKTFTIIGKPPEQVQGDIVSRIKNKKKSEKQWSNDFSSQHPMALDEANDGIVPRAIVRLFSQMEQKNKEKNVNYRIDVSYMELYNEQIYDLFNLLPTIEEDREKLEKMTKADLLLARKQVLKMSEEHGKNIVKGLRRLEIQHPYEGIQLLYEGNKNRQVGETAMNRDSSRSHGIFTIRLLTTEGPVDPNTAEDADNGESKVISELTIVDLAGSERASRTQNWGDRLREASSINTSLSVLGKCIETLRSNQKNKRQAVVPFRESKLTRMIQDTMSNGNVTMIVNISQLPEDADETLSVLKYASVAKDVQLGSKLETWRSPAHVTKVQSISARLLQQTAPASSSLNNGASKGTLQIVTTLQRQDYEDQIGELQSKIENFKREVAKLVAEAEYKVREELTREYKKQFDSQEVARQRRFENECVQYETKHEKQVIELKKTIEHYKKKLVDMESRLREEMEAHHKQSDMEISKRREEEDEKRNKLQEEMELVKEQEMELLKKEHDTELEQLSLEHEKSISELQNKLSLSQKNEERMLLEWETKYNLVREKNIELGATISTLRAQLIEQQAKLDVLAQQDCDRNHLLDSMKLEKDQEMDEKDRLIQSLFLQLETQRKDYFDMMDRVSALQNALEEQKNKQESENQPATANEEEKKKSHGGFMSSLAKAMTTPKKLLQKLHMTPRRVTEDSPDKRGMKRKSEALHDEPQEAIHETGPQQQEVLPRTPVKQQQVDILHTPVKQQQPADKLKKDDPVEENKESKKNDRVSVASLSTPSPVRTYKKKKLSDNDEKDDKKPNKTVIRTRKKTQNTVKLGVVKKSDLLSDNDEEGEDKENESKPKSKRGGDNSEDGKKKKGEPKKSKGLGGTLRTLISRKKKGVPAKEETDSEVSQSDSDFSAFSPSPKKKPLKKQTVGARRRIL